jgi:hypothetical protein
MSEVYYRFEDKSYSVLCGPTEDDYASQLRVHCHQYPVVKTTPKGVWLNVYGDRRFVLNEARKRFACPTVELAHESFKARKKRQIKIYESRIKDARQALVLADRVAKDPKSILH